jgi:hypothetical protein
MSTGETAELPIVGTPDAPEPAVRRLRLSPAHGLPVLRASDASRCDVRTPCHLWQVVGDRCGNLEPVLAHGRLDLTMPEAATALGLPGARWLRRTIRDRGLPPFRLLRDWWLVVVLLQRREETAGALALHVLVGGRDPAPYFRLMRRTTGRTWLELCDLGSAWARGAALRAWAPFLHPAPHCGQRRCPTGHNGRAGG